MEQPPSLPPISVLIAIAVAIWLCLSVWAVIISRLHSGKPVLPLTPRLQVPWSGIDLLLVFVFFVLSSGVMLFTIVRILGPKAAEPVAVAEVETSHAIVQLFRSGNPWTIMLCITSAVVVAPVVEEFLFRVLLQGWLEQVDRRLRPMLPVLRKLVPWGVVPIGLSSMVFAIVHFRVAAPAMNLRYLLYLMAGNCLVGISTMLFAILLLRLKNEATISDLGFVGSKVPQDIGLGLASAAAVIMPIFMLQAALTSILPEWIVPDPLPLFCFAVVLGLLYCRTHRVVASIVLHMSLNATSLLGLWLFMQG